MITVLSRANVRQLDELNFVINASFYFEGLGVCVLNNKKVLMFKYLSMDL